MTEKREYTFLCVGHFLVENEVEKTTRLLKNDLSGLGLFCFKEKELIIDKMQWIRPEELSDIRASAKKWKLERERKDREDYRQMSKEYGVKIECYGDLIAEIDRQDTIFRTCKLCKMVCATTTAILAHRNSENCRKRIAQQSGLPYLPKTKLPKYCKYCKIVLQAQNWKRHLTSTKHLENISMKEDVFYCSICNKDFTHKARPKRCFQKHLDNKIHLRKKAALLIV